MKKANYLNKIQKLFSILSDNTRLKIMMSLLDVSQCTCDENAHCGKCQTLVCMPSKSVGDIAGKIDASPSLVSHQIRVLKDQGLVSSKKEGLKVYYRLKDGHIQKLIHVAMEHVMEEDKK
jgi:ArsR family transcriptional regulator